MSRKVDKPRIKQRGRQGKTRSILIAGYTKRFSVSALSSLRCTVLLCLKFCWRSQRHSSHCMANSIREAELEALSWILFAVHFVPARTARGTGKTENRGLCFNLSAFVISDVAHGSSKEKALGAALR